MILTLDDEPVRISPIGVQYGGFTITSLDPRWYRALAVACTKAADDLESFKGMPLGGTRVTARGKTGVVDYIDKGRIFIAYDDGSDEAFTPEAYRIVCKPEQGGLW